MLARQGPAPISLSLLDAGTLVMPNDAKLGLIVGVGLVIAVAVVFFRKDGEPGNPPGTDAAAASAMPVPSPGGAGSVPAQAVGRLTSGSRRHTVQQGDTLASLAQKYYGDAEKTAPIYRKNQEAVQEGGRLLPGTVLTIPELP
jgi:hypothetical protein